MKKNKGIMQGVILVSQLGISMLVPIFLCVYIGQKLDSWFVKNYFTIIFLVLGIAAAYRNVYYLTKSFYTKSKVEKDIESEYRKAAMNERKKAEAEEEFNKWKETKSR